MSRKAKPNDETTELFADVAEAHAARTPPTESPRPTGGGASAGARLAAQIKRIQSLANSGDRLKACNRAVQAGLPELAEGPTRTLCTALHMALVEHDKLHLTLLGENGQPLYPTATAYYQRMLKDAKVGASASQVSSLLAVGRIGLEIVARNLSLPIGAETIRKIKQVDDPIGDYEKLHGVHQGAPPAWAVKQHLREFKRQKALRTKGDPVIEKPKGVWGRVHYWANQGKEELESGNTKAVLATLQKLQSFALRHQQIQEAKQ